MDEKTRKYIWFAFLLVLLILVSIREMKSGLIGFTVFFFGNLLSGVIAVWLLYILPKKLILKTKLPSSFERWSLILFTTIVMIGTIQIFR